MFSTTARGGVLATGFSTLEWSIKCLCVVCMILGSMASPADAQTVAAALFRIFLQDGSDLISYGEFARVGDRVVLWVPLGAGSEPHLRVVSIPESSVDWVQTDNYSAAVRAQQYAATRGEHDFVLLSAQVAAALNDVALAPNPRRRVEMAEEARRNLAAWPAANHNYRAADVAQLVATLDDVVAEMRIAAGMTKFDLSLVANPLPPILPAVLPPPDLRTSLETAYRAAVVASDPDERIALLRSLSEQLAAAPNTSGWAPELRGRTSVALAAELRIEAAYAELVRSSMRKAAERVARADIRGLQQIIAQALASDDRLGRKRGGQMTGLLAALDARLNDARRIRLARDGIAARVHEFKDYRDATKGARERMEKLGKWLANIRDRAGPAPASLQALEERVTLAERELASVAPPVELQPTHSLFVGAIHMARQAASLRRSALSANSFKLAWDASSAAAGSLMLSARATDELNRLISEAASPSR